MSTNKCNALRYNLSNGNFVPVVVIVATAPEVWEDVVEDVVLVLLLFDVVVVVDEEDAFAAVVLFFKLAGIADGGNNDVLMLAGICAVLLEYKALDAVD